MGVALALAPRLNRPENPRGTGFTSHLNKAKLPLLVCALPCYFRLTI